jgi:protein-S-isoprenylcysteine O-methyltransferase Ste14
MFALVRGLTYATLFIGLVLVFVPGRLLSWSGIVQPRGIGLPQVGGMIIGVAGAVVAVWCVLTFALVGKGTPAPFDAPRKLVIRGPYRFVRNPMYIGAGLALAGAALFYQSLHLLGYAALFFLVTHVLVFFYEEPTLQRTFGEDYAVYCRDVRRWMPTPWRGQ